MNMTFARHPAIAPGLLFCIGMIACGSAGIAQSLLAYRAALNEAATIATERHAIAVRHQRLSTDEERIRDTARAVQTVLRSQSAEGAREQDWITLLDEIQQKHQLIDVRHESGTPQTLAATPSESLALVSIPIQIRLKLLHEEDLTRFLDELRSLSTSLIHIKSCHIGRSRPQPSPHIVADHLEAACRIESIALQDNRRGASKP